MTRAPRPIGRPPAAESAATRQRILAAARSCFSERGYGQTTNRDIAAAAHITTGAIYHYFESKQDLYVAASDEVRTLLLRAFRAAVASRTTMREQLRALLRAVAELHLGDPTLATFVATYGIELRRHPELAAALVDANAEWTAFFGDLVAGAHERGELADDVDPSALMTMLTAVLTGLAQSASDQVEPARHVQTLRTFEGLLFDQLFASTDIRIGAR